MHCEWKGLPVVEELVWYLSTNDVSLLSMYVRQCGHKMTDTPKWFILCSFKVILKCCKDNAVEVHINQRCKDVAKSI